MGAPRHAFTGDDSGQNTLDSFMSPARRELPCEEIAFAQIAPVGHDTAMVQPLKTRPIGIIGDFDPGNESHLATNNAIQPLRYSSGCRHRLSLGRDREPGRTRWNRGLERALLAIRTAREGRMPLLGT
jgi:hypothetical protein